MQFVALLCWGSRSSCSEVCGLSSVTGTTIVANEYFKCQAINSIEERELLGGGKERKEQKVSCLTST